tara:strand:+ start:362 stop:574 length:213 start_codon:yes stop_codon:yes gene_type:complete
MPEKTIYVHLDFIKSGYNTNLFGRLTQLVECHPYKVEVTGSSPVSPTIKNIFYKKNSPDFFEVTFFLYYV